MALLIFILIVTAIILVLVGGYALARHVRHNYYYNIFGFWKLGLLSVIIICFYICLSVSSQPWYQRAYQDYGSKIGYRLWLGYNGYQTEFDNRHWSRGANVENILTLPFILLGKITDKRETELTYQQFYQSNLRRYQDGYRIYPPDKAKYDLDKTIYISVTALLFIGTIAGYTIYNAYKSSALLALPIMFYQILAAHLLIVIAMMIYDAISNFNRRYERGYQYEYR